MIKTGHCSRIMDGAVYAFVREAEKKRKDCATACERHSQGRHVKDFPVFASEQGRHRVGILLSTRLKTTARKLRGQMERENESSPQTFA